MLCKEQGITMAGVCALYEVFVAQKVRTDDNVGAVTDAYKRSRLPWFIDVTGLPTAALVDGNDRTKIVIIRETPVRFRLFTGARVPFFCFPFRVLS